MTLTLSLPPAVEEGLMREAVREKNERVLKDRMVFLSKQLSAKHLLENEAMDASTGDGLE